MTKFLRFWLFRILYGYAIGDVVSFNKKRAQNLQGVVVNIRKRYPHDLIVYIKSTPRYTGTWRIPRKDARRLT